MFKNHLRVAVRHLLKHKDSAFINIAGLTLGVASCVLIILYVQAEFSYDQFHQNKDRIYRVAFEVKTRSGSLGLAAVPPAVGPAMVNAFPELEKVERLHLPGTVLVSCGEKQFYENKLLLADSSFFEVFTFPLLSGSAATALRQPDDMVITAATAQKYFGAENPIGQTLVLNNHLSFKVVAVAHNLPRNSHFAFDFLVPFTALSSILERQPNEWGWAGANTYFLVNPGFNPGGLEALLPAFLERELGATRASRWRLYLQPLTAIYLHSSLGNEIGRTGNAGYAYVFLLVALFILVIACINFMNLATARSTERAREVGMRKVLGARRSSLIRQFLAESLITTVLALALGIVLVELTLPSFNALVQKQLQLDLFHNFTILGVLLLAGLIVGCLAGSYPALVLSGFQPVVSLKGGVKSHGSGTRFRQGLVVAQFAISIMLLAGMLMIGRQLEYMRNKSLGFNKEQVVVLPLRTGELTRRAGLIRNDLQKNSHVVSVALSSSIFNGDFSSASFRLEGAPEGERYQLAFYSVDQDFLPTMNIKIVAGRNFSNEIASDSSQALMVNVSAVKMLGWESPAAAIGKKLLGPGKDGNIIAVFEDFHINSLHEGLAPLVLEFGSSPTAFMLAKVAPGNAQATVQALEHSWQSIVTDHPFEAFFLDDALNRLYQTEQTISKLANYCSVLAICIACLGLFGLAAYTVERRTKEIGIRKVLGASVSGIIALLSREFASLVILANLLAWPAAYYALNLWLQDFAYRVHLSWWVFALAGGLALLIALLTVCAQAIKAALANPVEALRYE
jgi:putative ABC transport system permease protein